jgi:hypothetical protein
MSWPLTHPLNGGWVKPSLIKEDNVVDNFFCNKPTGKYDHLCTRENGHKGRCSKCFAAKAAEPFSKPAFKKIKLDAHNTPGDSKSVKNRADRCHPVQLSKEDVDRLNKQGAKGVGIRKKFASTPEDCQQILLQLTAQLLNFGDINFNVEVYDTYFKNLSKCMEVRRIAEHLKEHYREYTEPLKCRICKKNFKRQDFERVEGDEDNWIQIGHIIPPVDDVTTAHKSGNCHWIHRWCNLIQSDNTEEAMFQKLESILKNRG